MTKNIQYNLMKSRDEFLIPIIEHQKITKTMLHQSLNRIKDWYRYQPHLPRIELDDQYLIRHLIITKFDEERLKQRIDSLFTVRNILPKIFANRDPWGNDVSNILDSIEFLLMPSLTEEKYRITVLKLNIDNIEDYTTDHTMLCACMIADIRLYTDACMGDLFIFDFANITFNNIKRMHLPTLKNIPFLLQSCYGSQIKGIHLINTPSFADFIINVVKTGFSKKIAERLFSHSTTESFQKSFPIKYLPKDMGGDLPQTVREISLEWGKALKAPEMRKWIMNFDSIMKSDESKRLNKSDLIMSDLGTRGTFRKLDLD